MSGTDDSQIWEFARENEFVVLTKYKDFCHCSVVIGTPPKIVWINRGNCRNKELTTLIETRIEEIKKFVKSEAGLLVIK